MTRTMLSRFKTLALAVSASALMAATAGSAALAGDKDFVNIREAVATGVKTNPEYGAVANNRRATDEELKQAKALYLPSIDMNADTGYEHSDDPGTRGGADNDDEENLWRYDVGVTLTQMLFDGFETKYEVERQKNRIASASYRVRETSEFLGLDIVEAYLDVLRQRELLTLARDNVDKHVEILRQIEDGAQAGRSTQADVEQAKARVAAARAQESSVRLALRTAESTYARKVGERPKSMEKPIFAGTLLASGVDEEVKQALTQSPTLDIYESDEKVAKAEWKGSGSTLYPQVDLQLNGRTGEDLGGVEGRDTSASALVVMNWNLYRGGADIARTREHVYRHAQAKEARADAARAVEDDVRQTWARMESASERTKEFSDQANANAEVVRAYMDQFNLDRRTLLDVLDAQNEWFVSRSNAINSDYLEMFAKYRLLAVKGRLLAALDVPAPKESDPANKK